MGATLGIPSPLDGSVSESVVNGTFPLYHNLFNVNEIWRNWSLDNNSLWKYLPRATMYPLSYRITGTVLHSIIFIIGFLGNVMICVVVRKAKKLHTPTYCYLVSLAVADILLLCFAVPEAILSYHLYSKQWALGHVGCSVMVFTTFLAINTGVFSILAFTAERYIAICHPMHAHSICTFSRAKKISIIIWIVCLIYCTPWLGLAVTKPLRLQNVKGLEMCDYRLSRNLYLTLYVLDAALFYFLPLIVTLVLYTRMGIVLYRRGKQAPASTANYSRSRSPSTGTLLDGPGGIDHNTIGARVKVVKMLVVVVVCFGILWLPYRGLLVYNSVRRRPWLNKWYVLFAKTLVYCNSAINPFLYTLLSRRFRSAFLRVIFGYEGNETSEEFADALHTNLRRLSNVTSGAALAAQRRFSHFLHPTTTTTTTPTTITMTSSATTTITTSERRKRFQHQSTF